MMLGGGGGARAWCGRLGGASCGSRRRHRRAVDLWSTSAGSRCIAPSVGGTDAAAAPAAGFLACG